MNLPEETPSHIKEVNTLSFGSDLTGGVETLREPSSRTDLVKFRHPNRLLVLKLEKTRGIKVQIEARVGFEMDRSLSILQETERSCQSSTDKGHRQQGRLHISLKE